VVALVLLAAVLLSYLGVPVPLLPQHPAALTAR